LKIGITRPGDRGVEEPSRPPESYGTKFLFDQTDIRPEAPLIQNVRLSLSLNLTQATKPLREKPKLISHREHRDHREKIFNYYHY
jgi:hypothetical protein